MTRTRRLVARVLAFASLAAAVGACQSDPMTRETPVTTADDQAEQRVAEGAEVDAGDTDEVAVVTVVPASEPSADADAAHTTAGAEESEIVFANDDGSGFVLFAMASDGGGQRRLGSLDVWPFVLSPQASRIAFVSPSPEGNHRLMVMDVNGDNQRLLVVMEDDVGPVWSRDGSRLAFTDYAEDGSFDSDYEVYVVAADGESVPQQVTRNSGIDDLVGWHLGGSWSPDSAWLAFSRDHGTSSAADVPDNFTKIFVIDAAGANERQLVAGTDSQDWAPTWSPDGTKIAYFSHRNDTVSLWVIGADGSGARELIADYQGSDWTSAWSPDSTRLAFYDQVDDVLAVSVANVDGSGQRTLVTGVVVLGYLKDRLVWSPDGSQVAFSDSRDGDGEIFVVDAGGGNLRQLTDNDTDDRILLWS